ncbi:cysteine proteinase [Rhypophila decipiens]
MASTSIGTHGGAPPHTAADAPTSAPAFIPLEANPELMTSLIHNLGVSPALSIHDVYSLTDPVLLSFIPRPALGVLLVFPVSATYESHRLSEDSLLEPYTGQGPDEPVLWFKQTIRNACGLMGLLHASANGPARNFVEEGSDLDKLLKKAVDLGPVERSKLLEQDSSLAKAHKEAATQGATGPPQATDDVDLHYVCFVKTEDGTLWELDGRRKGPLKRGSLGKEEDVLSPNALSLGPLKFLEREGEDLRFSCVALAGTLD